MKNVKLYNEWFEVIHPRYGVVPVYPSKWNYATIYDAYQRPSMAKVEIWDYWCNFDHDYQGNDNPYYFGLPFISSRNCFKFTVMFNVYDVKTDEFVGVARITRDHNRLYLNK